MHAVLYLLAGVCCVAVLFPLPGNLRDKLTFVGMAAVTWPSMALFVVAWVLLPELVVPVVAALVVGVVVGHGRDSANEPETLFCALRR